MAKVGLLIGVSEYANGLNPLPAAVKDVEAVRRVLVNPEMGGFADEDITVLKDPQPQDIRYAIYNLFANRQKDDLLLFYFSGHGIRDDRGNLYFSTCATTKNNGKLVKPSAVAASVLHENINDSRSQRQVIILDCCFSGAIAQGMSVKDDGTVNVEEQLGGKGRAILTSSTSTQYSFEQEGSELSIYTRYLVEGIDTGAADIDGDGWISVDELHEYAGSKVQEASPAMTPKLYPVEGGYKILLAKSPKDDPRLIYRQELERRIRKGKLTIPGRRLLNSKRQELKIDPKVAEAIEAEVKQPYLEYQRKLAEYEQALQDTIAEEPNLSENTLNDLRDYQQHLGLKNDDVAAIERKILGQPKPTASVIEQPPKSANQFNFHIITVNAQGETTNTRPGKAELFPEDLGNGVILEMVKIPGGKFVMGSPENEPGSSNYERPQQHNVTIQPFFMGKYPVTQEQYEAIMGKNPSRFQGAKRAKRPVECVTWHNAVEFCAKISKDTGKSYRLPSEAEWEYACRAGTTTPFHFGETITTDLANYNGNKTYGSAPKGQYRQQTTDVGSFPANAFGLYDMHGNVLEWCQDNWHGNYNGAPINGDAWVVGDNDNQSKRTLRGGSWNRTPVSCRSACRYGNNPFYSYSYIGLRVVCVVGQRDLK
ncbi:caspase, EACC1-associated type [Calothrix rhizosoleniae]|uniref:caspase, EACC1-associated type n=1 Tax=Calothrix rhizosoleniae TaxID=888997 RepID=UPI000B49DA44|nr:SUMF1/EgtB/PvdO family nonheme iron enzyme [Calothrix rhizosoleniae]